MNEQIARLSRQYIRLRWPIGTDAATNREHIAARTHFARVNRRTLLVASHRERGRRVALLRKRVRELRLLVKGQS